MLTGSLVRLRPRTVDDAQLLAEWSADPEFGGFYVPIQPDTEERIVAEIREEMGNPDRTAYIVTDRETGEPLGVAEVFRYTHLFWMHGLEIGYTIHPVGRGRGVATQTARLLVNHAFDHRPIHRVQATVTVGNDASCTVLEHAGLQREGPMRHAVFLHGEYRDLHLYSITRDDWENSDLYTRRFPI